MRLDIHVFHHFDVIRCGDGPAAVLEAIHDLKETTMALSAKLQAAIDNSNAELADAVTKLDATTTVLKNMVDVGAAAVAAALAKVGVEEDAAAELVDSARTTLQEHVDSMFAVVQTLPTTGGGDTLTAPSVVTTSLPDAVTGQDYTAAIEFAGGTAPYSIANAPVTANGISVSTDGSVSGTSEADGDFGFSLAGSDSSDPPQTFTGSVSLHSASAAAIEQQ